ncbi:hypothetical protein SDC9_140683 [bioreactor metagenome]|uniref:Uncharacterized protein n=1 Tax=bioreactor metagenome TaxID=1076179 RepID=A0A645DVK8_9ZZZZ
MDVGNLAHAFKALSDQRRHRQPAPLEGAHHVGNAGECAFHNGAALVIHLRGERDGHGAAQRMAEDEAVTVWGALCQPIPRGAGVFQRRGFRGQLGRAFAEAAIVHGQHRESEAVHAPDARHRARDVPARAMQVQHHRRIRRRCRHPQCVQFFLGLRDLGRQGNPHIFQPRHVAVAAPDAVAGLEDPLALLGVERDHSGGQGHGSSGGRCGNPASFHDAGSDFTRGKKVP